MGINLSGAETGNRRRIPEDISPTQVLASIQTKNHAEKDPKSITQIPEVKPIEILSRAETKQILEKFQTLPAVLQKAVQGTRALHQEFQKLVQLTREPTQASRPTVTGEGASVNHHSVAIGPQLIRQSSSLVPNEESLIGHQTTAIPLKNFASNTSLPSMNENGIQLITQPLSLARVEKLNQPTFSKVQKNNPSPIDRALFIKPPEGISVAGLLQPAGPVINNIPSEDRVNVPGTPQQVPVQAVLREREAISQTVTAEPIVQQPVENKRPFVNVVLPIQEQPIAGKVTPLPLEPNKNIKSSTTSVSPIRNQQNAETIVPLLNKLTPQPVIDPVNPSDTSTSTTFQVGALSARFIGIPAGVGEVSPQLLREQSFQAFSHQLRKSGVESFVAEARQAARLFQVHPLTNLISVAQGASTGPSLKFGEGNTQPVVQIAGIVKSTPVITFETVARTTLAGDNGFQAGAVNQPSAGSLVAQNGNSLGVSQPVQRNTAPPLSNLNPPQRLLPTNVRSRLIPVQTVNLLDLVL